MQLRQKAAAVAILLTSLCPAPSIAVEPTRSGESEWLLIAKNVDSTRLYSGKSGSFELVTTKAGTPVALILGQIEDKADNSFTYGKWYVSTSDCNAGMGKIVFLTVSGDFDRETDFVSAGNNIASVIADLICSAYRSNLERKQGKGV